LQLQAAPVTIFPMHPLGTYFIPGIIDREKWSNTYINGEVYGTWYLH